MGVFETPQDSHDWAEKKHLLRYCQLHNNYFDPTIGCKDCEYPSRPIPKDEFDPLRMCKAGYKYYVGSYWRKIHFSETHDFHDTFTDSTGVWGKVTKAEATFELEVKEPEATADLTISEIPPTNESKKRIPIWANIYEHEIPEVKLTQPIVEPEPMIETPAPDTRPKHPSFGEDLKRMLFGK